MAEVDTTTESAVNHVSGMPNEILCQSLNHFDFDELKGLRFASNAFADLVGARVLHHVRLNFDHRVCGEQRRRCRTQKSLTRELLHYTRRSTGLRIRSLRLSIMDVNVDSVRTRKKIEKEPGVHSVTDML